MENHFDAEHLYDEKFSPVRYGSRSKLLRYLGKRYQEGDLTKAKYQEAIRSMLTLSEKIDLGTNFQRHR